MSRAMKFFCQINGNDDLIVAQGHGQLYLDITNRDFGGEVEEAGVALNGRQVEQLIANLQQWMLGREFSNPDRPLWVEGDG